MLAWSGLSSFGPLTQAAEWFNNASHAMSDQWVLSITWDAQPTDTDFVDIQVIDNDTQQIAGFDFVNYASGSAIFNLEPWSYVVTLQSYDGSQNALGDPHSFETFHFGYTTASVWLNDETVLHGAQNVDALSVWITAWTNASLQDITVYASWNEALIDTISVYTVVDQQAILISSGAAAFDAMGTMTLSLENYPMGAWVELPLAITIDATANQTLQGSIALSITDVTFVANGGTFTSEEQVTLSSSNTITVQTQSDLTVSMNSPNGSQFVIGGTQDIILWTITLTATNPASVNYIDVTLVGDISGAQNALGTLRLMENGQEIDSALLQDSLARFATPRVYSGTTTLTIQADSALIGQGQTWTDTQEMQFTASVNADSAVTIGYDQAGTTTSLTEPLVIGWVGIETIDLVGTYASEAVTTAISDSTSHTLAIIAVTAKDWSTTESTSGETVDLLLDSVTFGEIQWVTISNLQWRPFGSSIGSTITQTQGSVDLTALPAAMRIVSAGQTTYFIVEGELSWVANETTFSLNLVDLTSGWVTFSSTDSSLLSYSSLYTEETMISGVAITAQPISSVSQAEITLTATQTAAACASDSALSGCNRSIQEDINGITKSFQTFSIEADYLLVGDTPTNQVITLTNLWANSCLYGLDVSDLGEVSVTYSTDWESFQPLSIPSSGCISWVQTLSIAGAQMNGMIMVAFEHDTIPTTNSCITASHGADNAETVTIETCVVPVCGNDMQEFEESCDWSTHCSSSCTIESSGSNSEDAFDEQQITTVVTALTQQQKDQAYIDALNDPVISDEFTRLFEDEQVLLDFIDDVEDTTNLSDLATDPSRFVARQRALRLETLVKQLVSTEDNDKANQTTIYDLTADGKTVNKAEFVDTIGETLGLWTTQKNDFALSFQDEPSAMPIGKAVEQLETILATDTDGDGIVDYVEGIQGDGDNNDDGTQDSTQGNVATIESAERALDLTIDLGQSTACSQLLEFASTTENSIGRDDDWFTYPYGLNRFRVACNEVTVRVLYHGVVNLASLPYRKWSVVQQEYIDMSDFITYGETSSGVPYAEFTITDNWPLDDDLTVGIIVDDNGPAEDEDRNTNGVASSITTDSEHNAAGFRFNHSPTDWQALKDKLNTEGNPRDIEKMKAIQAMLIANNLKRWHVILVEPGMTVTPQQPKRLNFTPTDWQALKNQFDNMPDARRAAKIQAIQDLLRANNAKWYPTVDEEEIVIERSVRSTRVLRDVWTKTSNWSASTGSATVKGRFSNAFNRLLSLEFILKWSDSSVFYGNNVSFLGQLNTMIQGKETDAQRTAIENILGSIDSYDQAKIAALGINPDSIKQVLEFMIAEVDAKINGTPNTYIATQVTTNRPTTTVSIPVTSSSTTSDSDTVIFDAVQNADVLTDEEAADALIDSILWLFDA